MSQKRSVKFVCTGESGKRNVRAELIEGWRGGSDEVIAGLRQVDRNTETVQRQQTMKDLHVKYPKQMERRIHRTGEGGGVGGGGAGEELKPLSKTHLSASVSLELGTRRLSVR